MRPFSAILFSLTALLLIAADEAPVDFNRDIRPILSNSCYRCHGPDTNQRKAKLRFDRRESAIAQRDNRRAISPGNPEASELVRRIEADDSERMPPAHVAGRLSSQQIELLRRWILQGAHYQSHWSYEKPIRPPLPAVQNHHWPNNELDYFVLRRLEQTRRSPSPRADRTTLARRLYLDLTGLPPTPTQLSQFLSDRNPGAYERLVERLLSSPKFGERWAAMWLDLARYADSAGYANDPPRTIWLYRDWVINAFNSNLPFDQFTVDQLAGDLIPSPTQAQMFATAFHRNTLTNSEGGTNDEEFRSVAVVDRVNTTFQVWMGTTIRCAQCHNHKYDPISQKEYFQVYSFLNNTQDSDLANEQPVLSVFSDPQKRQRADWEREIRRLREQLYPSTEKLLSTMGQWEPLLRRQPSWRSLTIEQFRTDAGADFRRLKDGSVVVARKGESDVYRFEVSTELAGITGFRLDLLPHDSLPQSGPGLSDQGNFVLSEFEVAASGGKPQPKTGRYVRIELPGKQKMIHLAEVQVFSDGMNVAPKGKATQSSTGFNGPAQLANDGNTDGDYNGKSVSHTAIQDDPWWEVDLSNDLPIDRIVLWNRTDNNLQSRLDGFRLIILDAERKSIWQQSFAKAPKRELVQELSGANWISLGPASATYEQRSQPSGSWDAVNAIDGNRSDHKGWAVGGSVGKPHAIVFPTAKLETESRSVLSFRLTQQYGAHHTVGRFKISATTSEDAVRVLPHDVQEALEALPSQRTDPQIRTVVEYYRSTQAPPTELTDQIAKLEKAIKDQKPVTIPVMRELDPAKRRQTHIQIRGNFQITGARVSEAVPEVFHPLPPGAAADRLGFARWLVDANNPLTARVVANRFWEQLFGIGLVATSEEFGTQGELPSHPELLDWLATEFLRRNWDMKDFLRLLVQSATYQQSSSKTDSGDGDVANRLLGRGPRFRLSAEMIRDQALLAAGLLSNRLYGPSVRPPRPKLGLNAAFGSSTDWDTSPGADKFRRGLYTSWRRSLPYPSMATFDAPSRNVCTIRRIRTNTPLQALVTLNDPVYIEAAVTLAARILSQGGSTTEAKARFAFEVCLVRSPQAKELHRIIELYDQLAREYETKKDQASALAKYLPTNSDKQPNAVELAAWAVVVNVLLNLDETLVKR